MRMRFFVLYILQVDSGYLKHVFKVLGQLGYERTDLESMNWDILWAHDYPFNVLRSTIEKLRPDQMVNTKNTCYKYLHVYYNPFIMS